MSLGTQTLTNASASVRPMRRRRTRLGTDKKIQDDEFMAAAIGDVEWLKQSLRDQHPERGEINYDKNGLSALHLAAIHGRLDCIKVLIEKYKFDMNLASSTGWRAIHLCISNQTGKRAVTCLQYLLDKKADSSVANGDGITPAHQAASEGHVQCLKMLIENGAKIDGTDCRGHSPLDLAKLWGHRTCSRIIAAESWQQGKDHVAKEMKQLRKVKMQQVLKEVEFEAEFRAQSQHYSEEAFKLWLAKQGLDPNMPTGPKPKDNQSAREPLMKANSVSNKSKAGTNKASVRKADTIPQRSRYQSDRQTRDLSPLSRHTTTLTQESDGMDTGLYETAEEIEGEQEQRAKSAGFVNPNDWVIPLKVDSKPYVRNLNDDYPRSEYTMMPLVESAPKYYDGRHGPRLYKKDVKEGDVDTKKRLRKPNLPKEIVRQVMSGDASLVDRPIVFKPRHIHDVHTKKKYDDGTKGKSELSLHMCDDMSSFLFQNSLDNQAAMFDSGHRVTNQRALADMSNYGMRTHPSSRVTASSHLTSGDFPRDKVLQSMHIMSKPDVFPAIRGEEFSIGSGSLRV